MERGKELRLKCFALNILKIRFICSKQSVRNVQIQGRVCILDIEIEGVKQIRETDLNPLLVFILPPSIEELERRLRRRNTETEESLKKRLDTAKSEIDYGKEFVLILNMQKHLNL